MNIEQLDLGIADVLSWLEKNLKYADHSDRVALAALLNVSYTEINPSHTDFRIDSPVDILDEVQEQMKLVRTIRMQIHSKGLDANPKDLQSLVGVTTTLFAMLTKYNADIMNQDRIKSIENAVTHSIKTLSPEIQEAYFAELERLLSE